MSAAAAARRKRRLERRADATGADGGGADASRWKPRSSVILILVIALAWSFPRLTQLSATAANYMQQLAGADTSVDLNNSNLSTTSASPIVQKLASFNLQFYVYMEDAISLKHLFFWPKTDNLNLSATLDVDDNVRIFLPFLSHSLRTTNPEEADLFLVPTPWALTNHVRDVPGTLQALMAQPTFGDGHGHFFIMASQNPIFDAAFKGHHRNRLYQEWGPQIENMTILKFSNDAAVARLCQDHQDLGDWDHLCGHSRIYMKTSISMGIVGSFAVSYHPASWERFTHRQTIWTFLHPRRAPFHNNSTQYRHALLDPNITWPESFSPVSVGFEMPRDQWLHDLLHSKFCMVIRGDDPASSSLFKAIYAGCIPVIVSDFLPVYSPPFPHLLNIHDYSIVIPEQEFMADPVKRVTALANLDPAILRQKIQHLQVAQRILCIDHPESLFVQAVLHEVHRVNPRTTQTNVTSL